MVCDFRFIRDHFIALIFQEAGYETLVDKLTIAAETRISAPTLVECGIVLSARLHRDARGLLSRFCTVVSLL